MTNSKSFLECCSQAYAMAKMAKILPFHQPTCPCPWLANDQDVAVGAGPLACQCCPGPQQGPGQEGSKGGIGPK